MSSNFGHPGPPPLSLIMLCNFLTDPPPSCPNDYTIYVPDIFLEEKKYGFAMALRSLEREMYVFLLPSEIQCALSPPPPFPATLFF